MNKKILLVNLISKEKYSNLFNANNVSLNSNLENFNIFYGHAPLLHIFDYGVILINQENNKNLFFVSGGILEIQLNKINILIDHLYDVKKLDKTIIEESQYQAKINFMKLIKYGDKSEIKKIKLALSKYRLSLIALNILDKLN